MKGLELLLASGYRFEIKQLLFADDNALYTVADSEEN